MGAKTDELLQELINTQGPLGYARLAHEHESAITTAAVAALVVRPTTVSLTTIWNGSNVGSKSLVIDRIFCHQLISGAAQAFFNMWYCLHTNMTEPTNNIITLRGTGDGRESDVSTVFVDADATVKDDGWFPCGLPGEVEEVGTTIPGASAEWECNGRLVVPPRHGISLHVVAGTTAEDFTIGASWWRTQL